MNTISFEPSTMLSAYGHDVALADLPQEMVLALALHGFKQKLGDAAAMTKEEKAELGGAEAIEAKVAEKRKAIIVALREGKFSVGAAAGPRLRGVDAVMHEIAVEVLKGAFSAKGLKWPTGKGSAETIRGLAEKYISKNETTVRKEAQRRMSAQAAAESALEGII